MSQFASAFFRQVGNFFQAIECGDHYRPDGRHRRFEKYGQGKIVPPADGADLAEQIGRAYEAAGMYENDAKAKGFGEEMMVIAKYHPPHQPARLPIFAVLG